jgi:hypothetical protein
MLDESKLIKAQFFSAMKLVDWAVDACIGLASRSVGEILYGELVKYCKRLEREFGFERSVKKV